MAEDWSPDRHIDAVAPLLGLTITEEQRPGVRRFLVIAREMAELVAAASPPDTLDLAPVFVPLAPPAEGEPSVGQ